MRKGLKKVFRILFFLLALPTSVLFWILGSVTNKDATFAGFSQALSLIPGKIGTFYRAAFYSTVCKNVHEDIVVGFLTVFSHHDIEIEKGVYIGPQCNIGMCKIGENTLIGSGVHVLSGSKQHNTSDPDRPIKEQGGEFIKVLISEDCWIGNCSIIMNSIASRTIVAAGAIVVKRVDKSGEVLKGVAAELSNV